jgi:uncharacterized membrane protein YhaH (DUF805 family)
MSFAPNPYQSPRDYSPVDGQEPNRGLAWILFSFQGRIARRTYWGASIGVAVTFYAVAIGLVLIFGEEHPAPFVGVLLLYVPLVWTSLAIQVKRWHDVDKSGWWVLITFVPCIGPLWALVENGFLRGTFGPNDYGPDPT